MKPYPLRCWPRAMLLVSMPAITAGPPGVPWAALRSSRAIVPAGVVGQELESCPRRIKEWSPEGCPVAFSDSTHS